MIIKLVEAKARAATGYARALTAYMADADRTRQRPDFAGEAYGLTLSSYMTKEREEPAAGKERVLYKAALLSGQADDWQRGLADMEKRLARCSPRVKKPTRHVVISYRAGEHPSADDCAEAVAILAKELGCEASAALWAAHSDTGNIHIHVLFVMIDAETGSALPFGQGPGGRATHKEAMQRAIASIEHTQELQPERGARYEVVGGHVVRREVEPRLSPRRAPLRQEVLEFETRSGFASFTRTAQERAAPILEAAGNWEEVHRRLAAIGMGIRPASKGGEIFAGDDHVKLSNIDRQLSWAKLTREERLGPFQEAPAATTLASFEPGVLDGRKAQAWLARSAAEKQVAEQLDERIANLLAQRTAVTAKAKADHASRRADLSRFSGDRRLMRDLKGAWPRLKAQAVAVIEAEFNRRIAAVRGLRRALAIEPGLQRLDLQEVSALDLGIAPAWVGAQFEPPKVVPVPGFQSDARKGMVRYWPQSNLQRLGPPAFVDAGPLIWVNDRSDASIAAALTVASARFGAVAVFGDRQYLNDCARIAKRLGIEVEEITGREARRRATRKSAERDRARRTAAAKWTKEVDLQNAKETVQQGQNLSRGEQFHPPDAPLGGPQAAEHDKQRLNSDAENNERLSMEAPDPGGNDQHQATRIFPESEHPAILAWRRARVEKVALHEQLRLASLAMRDLQVRQLAGRSPSSELNQLAEDARQHRLRSGRAANQGRSVSGLE